jgi:predicted metal-dependent hydrolase
MNARLKVRSIDFQFTDDIPTEWNGHNPGWANAFHYLCFMAPGFERYFVRSVGRAIKDIRDPAVAEDARLFCRQEGQHARHHVAQLHMLERRYPGIESIISQITEHYDLLYEQESIPFHLAYMAVVEATFAPVTRFIIVNREHLFDDPDPRMASFMMWHFVEEYEHRHSAHDIFEDVVGSYTYRLRSTPKIVRHLAQAVGIIRTNIDRYIPPGESGLLASESTGFLRRVPWSERARVTKDLLATLLPSYRPDHVQLPTWVQEWFEAEEKGVDMRTYFPSVSP